MKILYVWAGNPSITKFEGAVRPPDELYVEGAMKNLGIDVRRSHYRDPELRSHLQAFQPDLVLFSHPPAGFDWDVVLWARENCSPASYALLSFDLTTYPMDPGREERYEYALRHLDFFCTKETARSSVWASRGISVFRAVQGYHPYVERVWEPQEKETRPAVFLGSYSERRDKVLSKLQTILGPDLVVHSQTGGWKLTRDVRPPVFGPDRNALFANASCVIDVGHEDPLLGYYSDRVVDVLAAGVPLITEGPSDFDHVEQDFGHARHLICAKADASNLAWWVRHLRENRDLVSVLSLDGCHRVRTFFTYEQTVRDVLTAREAFMDSKGTFHVAHRSQELRGRKVAVLGQWRAQGLGYVARAIVEAVEEAGGEAKVASINRNPEWQSTHTISRDEPPSEGTGTIFFLEKCDDAWLDWAEKNGAKTIYFPMWDFFGGPPRSEMAWAKRVDVIAAVDEERHASGSPSPRAGIEAACGRVVIHLPWDAGIVPRRPVRSREGQVVFFHDARGLQQGKYDVRPRQNTKYVLQAWAKLIERLGRDKNKVSLLLRAQNRSLSRGQLPPECTQVTHDGTREELFRLIQMADVAIHVASPEGIGLPVAEYQALGTVPVVLQHGAAGCFVDPRWNGMWTDGAVERPQGLTERRIPDVDQLAKWLHFLVKNRDILEILKEGCYKTSLERQGRFAEFVRSVLSE